MNLLQRIIDLGADADVISAVAMLLAESTAVEKRRASDRERQQAKRAAKPKTKKQRKQRAFNPESQRITASGRIKRRKIAKGIRLLVIERDEGKCVYCGVVPEVIHLDHRLPISKGGLNVADNLCVSCPPCNLSKAARLIGGLQ